MMEYDSRYEHPCISQLGITRRPPPRELSCRMYSYRRADSLVGDQDQEGSRVLDKTTRPEKEQLWGNPASPHGNVPRSFQLLLRLIFIKLVTMFKKE
jgi:hypothetical protein